MTKTKWMKASLGIAAVLVGCSDSSTGQFPNGQFSQELRVVYSLPDYLAEDSPRDTTIFVQLSEPVDPSSIGGITVKQTVGTSTTDITANGQIDLAESNSALIFSHSTNFGTTAGITMYLPGTIRAASGKSMVPTNVTFFTGKRMDGFGAVSVPGAPHVVSVQPSSYYTGCIDFVVTFNEDLATAPRAQVQAQDLWGAGSSTGGIPLNVGLNYGSSLQSWVMSLPEGYCPCSMFGADVDVKLTIFGTSVFDLDGQQLSSNYNKTWGWGDDFSPMYCY